MLFAPIVTDGAVAHNQSIGIVNAAPVLVGAIAANGAIGDHQPASLMVNAPITIVADGALGNYHAVIRATYA
jgi:hypothetical protein